MSQCNKTEHPDTSLARGNELRDRLNKAAAALDEAEAKKPPRTEPCVWELLARRVMDAQKEYLTFMRDINFEQGKMIDTLLQQTKGTRIATYSASPNPMRVLRLDKEEGQ